MLRVGFDIQGTEAVVDGFTAASGAVRARVKAALETLGQEIKTTAQAGAPRLHGALQGGIWFKVKELGNGFVLKVAPGRRQFYAASLEKGVDRDVDVRSYRRRNASGDVFQVVGRTRRKRVAQGFGGLVGAYTRHARIQAHPFMTPAFESVKSDIPDRIDAAIQAALAEVAR